MDWKRLLSKTQREILSKKRTKVRDGWNWSERREREEVRVQLFFCPRRCHLLSLSWLLRYKYTLLLSCHPLPPLSPSLEGRKHLKEAKFVAWLSEGRLFVSLLEKRQLKTRNIWRKEVTEKKPFIHFHSFWLLVYRINLSICLSLFSCLIQSLTSGFRLECQV